MSATDGKRRLELGWLTLPSGSGASIPPMDARASPFGAAPLFEPLFHPEPKLDRLVCAFARALTDYPIFGGGGAYQHLGETWPHGSRLMN